MSLPLPSTTATYNDESALLRERMEVMFWQEVSHYATSDYLNFTSLSSSAASSVDSEGVMSEQWRTRMCEWAYQLVDHFDMPRHIVGITMNSLDRYLAKYFARLVSSGNTAPDGIPRITKKQFQLITMSCLYLAMKMNGTSATGSHHYKIPISYMVKLSRGTFSEEELVEMEKEILSTLGWMVNPTTAVDFLKHYLQLLHLQHNQTQSSQQQDSTNPRLTALEDLASFLVELSVLDYYFVNFRPSTVAIAALLNAMDEDPIIQATLVGLGGMSHNGGNPFFPVQSHTLYYGLEGLVLHGQEEAVYLCRQRLGSLYQNANTSDTNADAEVAEPTSPTPQAADDKNQRMEVISPVSVMAAGAVTTTAPTATATAATYHEMYTYCDHYHHGY